MSWRSLLRRAASVWSDHPLGVTLGALSLLYIAALWSVSFPPLLDYGAHLGVAEEVRALLFDARPPADVQLMTQPWPGCLGPLLWAALGQWVGMELAGKILLGLIVVSVPLATASLSARLGGSRWVAIAALPLLCGPVLMLGRVSFLLALPPLLVAITLPLRLRGLRHVLALAGVTVLIFLTHVWPALLLAPLALAAAALAARERMRRVGEAASGIAAGYAVTVLPWLVETHATFGAQIAGARWFESAVVPSAIEVDLLEQLLHMELLPFGYQWLLLLLAGLLVWNASRRPGGGAAASRQLRVALPLLTLLLVAALPGAVGQMTYLTGGLLLPLALLVLPALWAHDAGGGQRALRSAVVGVNVVFVALLAVHLRQQQALEVIDPLVAAIPAGSKVAVLAQRPGEACAARGIRENIAGLVAVRRQARTNLLPLAQPTSWIQYREGSPRRELSVRRCARDGRALQVVSRLTERRSRHYDFAVAATGALRRQGDYVPVIAAPRMAIYRNTRSARRVALPAVVSFCQLGELKGRQLARCRYRLPWPLARSSCRAWGGELTRAHDTRKRSWADARFDSARGRWSEPDAVRRRAAAGVCQTVAAGRRRATICGQLGTPVCGGDERVPVPSKWNVLGFDGGRLLLGQEARTFGAARAACRRLGLEPIVPDDRAERLFVHTFSLDWPAPIWLGVTPAAPTAGAPGACGVGRRGVGRCDDLRPFCCVKDWE